MELGEAELASHVKEEAKMLRQAKEISGSRKGQED
jgi:hypothetical protein